MNDDRIAALLAYIEELEGVLALIDADLACAVSKCNDYMLRRDDPAYFRYESIRLHARKARERIVELEGERG